MKIKVNRNILWAEAFVNELSSLGVKYASLSPGSRNTPLTLAFANNKKIKSYLHIDERSSGFFALGMAKSSGTPVAVVCTSGTATAELYPAIVEAYQQRVPLIICTADRPPELRDLGANQTINQTDMYKNHIRWFADPGLPVISGSRILRLKSIARNAVFVSTVGSRGPVHINFPFKKPFEPKSYTDEISKELLTLAEKKSSSLRSDIQRTKSIKSEKWFIGIFNHLKKNNNGLIIVGPENYNPKFLKSCQVLSHKLGYPILADGTSQLRFGRHKKNNIISNFDAFLRSESFVKNYNPEIILQFGRTITSKGLETFLNKCSSVRYMINEYGDWFDPSDKATAAYACKPYFFCQEMVSLLDSKKINRRSNGWLSAFKNAESLAAEQKDKIIGGAKFPAEGRIIEEIINEVPDNCTIMLSNSMPVRDFDYFASNNSKNLVIHNNRGASGIDGITSTALGIAEASGKPALLITGDLAFYYDLNGLLGAKKYAIPLVIVLINNNGGGIFEILPISNYGRVFNDYFIAPHHLDFSHFVKAYGGNFSRIQSWSEFRNSLKKAFTRRNFSVLEIKTDAVESTKLRRKFWDSVSKKLKV